MKLEDEGIVWIDDSETYVAAVNLFASGEAFLKAVLSHITDLLNSHIEAECGWYIVPEYDKHIDKVTTSYMVHRINSDWHDGPFWEQIDEPGPGHKKVWCIDFARDR